MLIRNILSELRREPSKNPKIVGHEGAYKRLEELEEQYGSLDNFGVSMTKVEKLGINPRSEYETPIGVYFYPASYYMYVQRNHDTLPHENDAPYIQIFKWDTPNVLDIKNMSKKEYTEKKYKLEQMFGLETIRLAWEWDEEPLVASPGGYFWFLLYYLTREESKPSIAWNKLIRELGYDVIVDNGAGIIHVNEPDQGVVLNPGVIKLVDTIQQKYHTTKKPHRQWSPFDIAYWAVDHKTKLSPKLEKFILKDLQATRIYLLYVNPNWKNGIEQAKVDPELAYAYTKTILKKPWPEAEKYISQNQFYGELYARDFLNDPDWRTWPSRYAEEHNLPAPKSKSIQI